MLVLEDDAATKTRYSNENDEVVELDRVAVAAAGRAAIVPAAAHVDEWA